MIGPDVFDGNATKAAEEVSPPRPVLVRVADVQPEAEAGWTAEIVRGFRDTSAFMSACTPSRLNFEGDMTRMNPRTGNYRGGYGDFFAYQQLLRDWRARGDFAGLRLEEAEAAR